jgi:uncharacterized Zn finger protein
MLEDQIFCPSCGTETEHVTIKSGQESLVRCEECEAVHSVQKERERLTILKVIVNKGGVSQPYHMKIPAREVLSVGEELLVDDELRDVVLTKITSLETDRRVKKAAAGDIKTAWARAVDEVDLKVSVYRKGLTRSMKTITPGDDVFELGEVREIDGVKFKVVKIKLRDEGFADIAQAKDITRVWGREI